MLRSLKKEGLGGLHGVQPTAFAVARKSAIQK
jgi:hypothetical protein